MAALPCLYWGRAAIRGQEADLLSLLCCLLQQVLVEQGSHPVQYRERCVPECSRDLLDCCKRAATDEDREQAEEPLFLGIEQIIAPLDRVAQGLLACGHISRIAGQELQTLAQTGQQCLSVGAGA